MQSYFKLLLMVQVVALTAYLAVCIFLLIKQPRFIFFPSSVIEKTPEFFNLPYEEVWLPVPFNSGDAGLIHGWWMEAQQPEAKVLLYLHGNGINIGANISHPN
jgi:hypothetical protein